MRAQEPELFGFTHVTGPEQWPQDGAAAQVVADFTDPWEILVISADRPDDVDADALLCTDLLDMSRKTLAAQQWFAAERVPTYVQALDAVVKSAAESATAAPPFYAKSFAVDSPTWRTPSA